MKEITATIGAKSGRMRPEDLQTLAAALENLTTARTHYKTVLAKPNGPHWGTFERYRGGGRRRGGAGPVPATKVVGEFIDFVRVVLDTPAAQGIGAYLLAKIADECWEWAKTRTKRTKRETVVTLYGPDGKMIKRSK